ncbi:hypothetical protein C5167_001529 [Papaver somniferum]|uniref:tRNA/rRNA methyltransferase SpoU type domain-containing protein n=1 Tax=Papaver somniferum TaxID=3469 RepID=A0A4Y7KVL3_PAPSO|nr:hypothetical protein C5167_001529 [Papaver somniferum]
MESCTRLRTLNFLSPLHHFRSGLSLIRPFLFPKLKNKPSLSISSSAAPHNLYCISKKGEVNSLPRGAGEAFTEVTQNRLLQVVLVSPQIPGNTGCIARTCAASAVGLHLVEPLGYEIDDAKLKRAGLDYWPYPLNLFLYTSSFIKFGIYYNLLESDARSLSTEIKVRIHTSWAEFRNYYRQQEGAKRLLAFTKRGTSTHSDFAYRRGDWLVFGSETSGLPPEALFDCQNEILGGGTIRIPMIDTYVRCLNLSVSAGIAVYEASRQLNYEQLEIPAETCIDDTKESFITEDIFA